MERLNKNIGLIRDSGLFDENWYVKEYADVKITGMDPIRHYLQYGAVLGRKPSISFDTTFYLQSNKDVSVQGINPLLHYIEYGFSEGRSAIDNNDKISFSLPSVPALAGARLYIDTCDQTGIIGWYSPPQDAHLKQSRILLQIDDNLISAASPNIPREDVIQKLKRSAAGFSFEIPEKFLDGAPHVARIYVSLLTEKFLAAKREFSLRSPWVLVKPKGENKDELPIILFCSHNLRIQGAQTSLLELASGLRSRFPLTPVIYSPSDGPMRKRYESLGINVIIQPKHLISDNSKGNCEYDLRSLTAGIAKLSPQAIIANTLESYYPAIAAQELKIPHILIPRESEPPETYFAKLPEFIRDRADKVVEKSDAVVFVAKSTRALWESKNSRNHFHTIQNGLSTASIESRVAGRSREEVRLEFGLDSDEIAILTVGTVTERKGQLDLIKAIPILNKLSHVRFRVFIVGMNDSEYSKEIELRVSKFTTDTKTRIHLLPETNSDDNTIVTDLYLASDIFVMNSRHESYPRVILEALYFGLPIVSTPCFGVCEQVIEKESALFYEEGDNHALAYNLSMFLNYPDKLNNFTKKATSRFDELISYQQMISAYSNALQKIMF